MSDSKKYYYMRLKEDFFDSEEQQILEAMPDGYLYSNILLKLYLKSLKRDGLLMLNDKIPYNARMIALITRHQQGTVEKALSIFQQLHLIDVLDSGAIYMSDIQNFVGKTTTEADRIRNYRAKIESEKIDKPLLENKGCTNVQQMYTRDRDRDRDRDKDILTVAGAVASPVEDMNDIIANRNDNVDNSYAVNATDNLSAEHEHVNKRKRSTKKDSVKFSAEKKTFGVGNIIMLTQLQYDRLIADYGEDVITEMIAKMEDWIVRKGHDPYGDHNLAIRKWLAKDNAKKIVSPVLNEKKEEMQGVISY